jgi:hypothetical protein
MTRNILSVMCGVAPGIIIFVLLGLIFFAKGMLMWTDGKTKEEMLRSINNIMISYIIMNVFGSMVAGFIATLISRPRKIIYSVITAILLIILWFISNGDFELENFEKIVIISIVPFSMLGGWLCLSYKSRAKRIASSPADTV